MKNTFINFIGMALPLFIGLLTIPFVIRKLGTDRFGILSLIWVVFGYFGILDLGLGRATIRYIAACLGTGNMTDVPRFYWTTILLQGGFGIIGAALIVIATPLLTERILNIPAGFVPEAKTTFLILAFSLPITIITPAVRGVLEAAQRFDLVNLVKIPASAAFYLLPFLGVLVGFKLPGIVLLIACSRVLALVAWGWLTRLHFPTVFSRIAIDRTKLRPLLGFGGWVTLSSLIWPVITSLDRFMIGAFLTMSAVSFYSAPYEVVTRLGVIPGSLGMTLFPAFSVLNGRENAAEGSRVFIRSTKYLFLVLAPLSIFLAFFAGDFLQIWLGGDFRLESTRVFQILLLGYLAGALANIPYGFLQAVGRPDLPTKYQLIELAYYGPLMWVFIKTWGIAGAAAAWTIRSLINVGLHYFGAWKMGAFHRTDLKAAGIRQAFFPLTGYALCAFFLPHTIWGAIAFLLLSGATGLALWRYPLGSEERSWLRGKVTSILSVGKQA